MDLQSIFYLVGIIFMSLSIIILMVIGIVVFYIKKKIEDLQKVMDEKIDAVTRAVSNPGAIASTVGTVVADQAVKRVKGIFNKKKK